MKVEVQTVLFWIWRRGSDAEILMGGSSVVGKLEAWVCALLVGERLF